MSPTVCLCRTLDGGACGRYHNRHDIMGTIQVSWEGKWASEEGEEGGMRASSGKMAR